MVAQCIHKSRTLMQCDNLIDKKNDHNHFQRCIWRLATYNHMSIVKCSEFTIISFLIHLDAWYTFEKLRNQVRNYKHKCGFSWVTDTNTSHSMVSHSLNKHDTWLFELEDQQQHNSIHCSEKINSIAANANEINPILISVQKQKWRENRMWMQHMILKIGQ